MKQNTVFSSTSSAELLTVDRLTVRLETARAAFDAVSDVSFAIRPGETLSLVGESGCGKSLTALAILRLLPEVGRLSAGRVLYEGEDLASFSEADMRRVRGRRIGMIFQEPMTSLNPVLRVGDQVAEPLMQHLRLPRREALSRAVELFQQVGIPAPENRIRDYPHQLSGGMRQRVMIAMALACSPQLLLADEPTTALDVTIQGQILALLKQLTAERGMGLLLITHDLGVVAETADRVGVMYAGQIVEQAAVRDLFKSPLHPYTVGLMGSVPTVDMRPDARLAAIPGTVPPPGLRPSGCLFQPRCPKAFDACAAVPPLLDHQAEQGGTRQVRCWLHA